MAITQEHIDKAINISKLYNVKRLILFGSSAEDISKANDLDLAISGLDSWKFFEFAARLEEELRVKIDTIPLDEDSRIGNHIIKTGKVLYERT